MFGPNPSAGGALPMHHREPAFHELVRQLRAEMTRLVPGYRYLFLTGSGTLGIESVLWSMDQPFCVASPDRHFAKRICAFLAGVRLLAEGRDTQNVAWVAYETASAWRMPDPPHTGLRVVDMVSAWPYYDVPTCDAWVTVSGKQVGAAPGVAIVGLSRRAEEAIADSYRRPSSDYRELSKWLSYDAADEMPHTPAIGVLWDLWERLRRLDPRLVRDRINDRRAQLMRLAPSVWDGAGPVVNLRRESLPPGLVERWKLYDRPGYPQLFLWSPEDREFEAFVEELRCAGA